MEKSTMNDVFPILKMGILWIFQCHVIFQGYTLQGKKTYPFPKGTIESVIFFFPRWDMLVSSLECIQYVFFFLGGNSSLFQFHMQVVLPHTPYPILFEVLLALVSLGLFCLWYHCCILAAIRSTGCWTLLASFSPRKRNMEAQNWLVCSCVSC